MDNGTLSASDVALLSGNNGFGFGNDGSAFMWIFALLILAGGGFGGGFGGWGNNGFANAIGYENLATSNEVQRGFDSQNAMANQREILSAVTSGTAQSVAATNQSFHDTLSVVSDKYSELARDIAAVQVGQANALANQNACCCDTKMQIAEGTAALNAGIAQARYDSALGMAGISQNIAQSRYDDALNTAAVNANIAQQGYNAAMNTAAINANTTAQTQKILDALQQNKIEALQAQVNALELQAATSNVLRYPSSWTYNAGMSPFCGCNAGCGCGNI